MVDRLRQAYSSTVWHGLNGGCFTEHSIDERMKSLINVTGAGNWLRFTLFPTTINNNQNRNFPTTSTCISLVEAR